MDVVSNVVGLLSSASKQELFIGAIVLECIFTLAFVICSFFVAEAANAGFNCVLTGFLNIAYLAGSYHVIKNSKAPIAIGFLIGSSGMMTFLNFITGIYWGELSNCNKSLDGHVAQYSCNNPTAYGAVSAFAVLLFISQLIFTACLVIYRGEFISETGVYDDETPSGATPVGYHFSAPHFDKAVVRPPPSADL